MRPVVAEGLGTAVLVVTACAAAASPSEPAPLTVAAVWGALLVAGRRAGSPGPFLHPALTAAAWAAGRLRSRELVCLLAAQLAGGALGAAIGARAAGLVAAGTGSRAVPVEPAEPVVPVVAQALPVEALVVAVITLVALSAATSGPGLPVALIAGAAAVLVGPVTGGAFNPAVAAALAHTGVLPWELAVAYAPAHLAGALAAALVVKGTSTRRAAVRVPVTEPPVMAPPVVPSRTVPSPAVTGVPRPRQVADPVRPGS